MPGAEGPIDGDQCLPFIIGEIVGEVAFSFWLLSASMHFPSSWTGRYDSLDIGHAVPATWGGSRLLDYNVQAILDRWRDRATTFSVAR